MDSAAVESIKGRFHFIVTRPHRYTLEGYLNIWGRNLRSQVQFIHWEDVPHLNCLPKSTYILADLERLTGPQMTLAKELTAQLESGGSKVLNRPARVLRRYSLLQRLHELGRNRFNAYRAASLAANPELMNAIRFPVFLRRDSEHDGAISALLHDASALRNEIETMSSGREARWCDDLLVVEYIDARLPGESCYRKYSVFRVGDQLVTRHLLFADHWVVKYNKCVDPEKLAAEAEFFVRNPHAAEVREIFDVAGIDYGRIDYAVVDGRVQTWEINTNPTVMSPPGAMDPRRLRGQGEFAARMESSLRPLLDDGSNRLIGLHFDPATLRALGVRRITGLGRMLGKAINFASQTRIGARCIAHVARARELARL